MQDDQRAPLQFIARPRTRALVVSTAVIILAALAWFISLPSGVIMGDDLVLVYGAQHGGYASDPLYSVFQVAADKYRPVLTVLLAVMIRLFESNFTGYFVVNLLVELGLAALVCLIAYRLSRGNLFLATVAALAFVVSRFGYYAVAQIFGLMENLGLAFTLLAVYDGVVAFQEQKPARLYRQILWYFLAVFADERYVVLLPFLIVCGVASYGIRSNVRRLAYFTASAVSVLLVNVVLKSVALHVHFLQGTGGQPIAFNIGQIVTFVFTGIGNTLGFNIGPEWLSTRDISQAGPVGYVLGALVCLPTLALCIMYVSRVKDNRYAVLRDIALGSSLYFPLVLSASITIRQEFRWLYVCSAVVIIAIAAIAGQMTQQGSNLLRRSTVYCATFALGASVLGAVYYRPYVGHLYFEQATSVAKQVLAYVQQSRPHHVLVETNGDHAVLWALDRGAILEAYGFSNTVMTFADSAATDSHIADVDPSKTLVLSVHGTEVNELNKAGAAAYTQRNQYVSFLRSFETGTINSHIHVSSPSGSGVFIENWPTQDGEKVTALNIISGFRYKFVRVRVLPRTILQFRVAKPLRDGIDDVAFVDVSLGGHRTSRVRVFEKQLQPAGANFPQWQDCSISLDRFSGKSVDIIFGADALQNDATAAWVAYANPGLVALPHEERRSTK